MTKQIIPLIFLLVSISCNFNKSKLKESNRKNSPVNLTEIYFESETHNFGKLKSGEIVIFAFVFTNTGENDLIIKDVKVDCGCINVNFSNKSIEPGKTGMIEVEFDSSGLFGNQFKSINVEANVSETKHLAIFAEVNNDQLKITY